MELHLPHEQIMMTLCIVNIGQLVTLAGPARSRAGAELRELGVIADAALLIEDGRITAVGTRAEIRASIGRDAVVIDAKGGCVTPGFVDAHTHLVFAGNRADEFEKRIGGATYQEIAAAGGGILRTVKLTRAASEDELLAAARRHRDWMLRGGTTTLEAKSGYGLDHDTELKMLRVLRRLNEEGPARIVPTLLAAHTVPPEFADRRSEYVRWIAEELIPEVAAAGMARYCDAFCDDHAFTVDEARVVLDCGEAAWSWHSRPCRAVSIGYGRRSGSGIGRGHRRSPGDGDGRDTDPIARCRRAACSSAWVGLRARPDAVSAGAEDGRSGPRYCAGHGLQSGVVSRAVDAVHALAGIVEMGLSPAEALTAATINAAWSLGLGDSVGSLENGKQADFLIHEFKDYRELAYFIAAPMRPRVFVGGREVTP